MPDTAGSGGPPVGGLLLVRASLDRVATWVGRSILAAHVTPFDPWTAVTIARSTSAASAPYDDARATLAARPIGTALRPSICFVTQGPRAVIVVQPSGWRSAKLWLVWSPDLGVVRSPRLPPARPADLASVAGIGAAAVPRLVDALRSAHATPLAWLEGVHAALKLPGHGLLTDATAPRGRLIEPAPKQVHIFESIAAEEAAHLAEVAPPDQEEPR